MNSPLPDSAVGLTSAAEPPAGRVSPVRVMIVLLVAGAVAAGLWWQVSSRFFAQDAITPAPVTEQARFSGYVDVTLTPTHAFESPVSTSNEDVVLAFVVADPAAPCTPTWGGAYTLDEAQKQLDLDRRLQLLRLRGGDYTVSFGGAVNDEISTVCTDEKALRKAYLRVIERYEARVLDLDIEFNDLQDRDGNHRRAKVLAQVQESVRADGDELDLWLTLPVAPHGLTADGLATVEEFLAAGVDLRGVNVMTMNYGEARESDETMVAASIRALESTHEQLTGLWTAAGQPLSAPEMWQRIGMTPMLGRNDLPDEVIEIADAEALAAHAREVGLGRVSAWSLNRDRPCGPNYVNLSVVSNVCSGVSQAGRLFSDVFAQALAPEDDAASPVSPTPDRSASPSALPVTRTETPHALPSDDPRTSPYALWNRDVHYFAGDRVVRHGMVFEAKWWSSGDVPDDPTAVDGQAPWRLLGPVLAGEKPYRAPTLAGSHFPAWSPTRTYSTGERVLLKGIAWRALRTSTGERPSAALARSGESAWVPLSDTEVERLRTSR